jgi:hemerythrin-like domain-containing protein
MAATPRLPDLFGRATLVLGGHDHLRGAIDGLRQACAAIRSGEAVATEPLKERTEVFCERVLVHFAAEEGADYFGALASESLELSEGIASLRAEHAELTRLIMLLRAIGRGEAAASVFAEALERFLDRLVAHERRETTLLYGFFRPEEGSKP